MGRPPDDETRVTARLGSTRIADSEVSCGGAPIEIPVTMPNLAFALYFGVAIGTAQGFYWLFDKAGENLEPEKRAWISQWLQNTEVADRKTRWPTAFVALFDTVFGKKHFSLRCFRRSALASVAAVSVVAIAASAVTAKNDLKLTEVLSYISVFGLRPLAIIFVTNILGDYVSLLETRYLLVWMNRSLGRRLAVVRVASLLLLDVVLTAVIWIGTVFLGLSFVGGFFPLSVWGSPYLIVLVMILFPSTYFTSLWLWLFVGAGVLMKVRYWSRAGLARSKRGLRIFNVRERPLRVLGYVGALVVFAGFMIAWPVLS